MYGSSTGSFSSLSSVALFAALPLVGSEIYVWIQSHIHVHISTSHAKNLQLCNLPIMSHPLLQIPQHTPLIFNSSYLPFGTQFRYRGMLVSITPISNDLAPPVYRTRINRVPYRNKSPTQSMLPNRLFRSEPVMERFV